MKLFNHCRGKQGDMKSEAELRRHRCAFTGHRPEKVIGKESFVVAELRKAIEAAINEGYTTFVTGCSRGTDLWAADIVIELRRYNKELKLICAVPFEGFEERWEVNWIKHYRMVRKQADWVQVIATEYSPEVYQRRNIWMVKKASRLIGVYDGSPSGTKNTIDYAISQAIPVQIIEV